MGVTSHSEIDSAAARRIWETFERGHDLSGRTGQTAGVDPASGRIWFGESVQRVIEQRDADGCTSPLYFIRVGSPTYYRKGGRR